MKRFNIHNWQAKQRLVELKEKEGVKHYTKDGKEWTGKTHKMPNGKLMTQNPHNEDSEELFHKEDLNEQSFDQRLAQQMGMSDDEFEDQIASRDIGDESPFLDNDDISPGIELASRTIGKLRQQYRGMSDDIMDDFSVEMIKHFLDNYKAQAAAKAYFTKKGL
jgi:hypothetical protein